MLRRILLLFMAVVASAQVPYWAEFTRHPHPVELAAQVRQESAFNPTARSHCGAMGLAQFMPGTWVESIRRGWVPAGASPWEPTMAIRAQAGYTGYLLDYFRGDWPKAWAGYNCGEGRVRRIERRVQGRGIRDTEGRRVWLSMCPEETRGYVDKIERIHVPWVRARVGNQR